MRYWFPSYPSKIFTVCSPTERSSWVLRAEPWKWKYANIYSSLNNRSEKVIWSWFPDQVFRHVILNSRFLFYDIFHVITLPSLLADYVLPVYLLFSTFVRLFWVRRPVVRRFKKLFLPLHYCSLSSQQKHSFTFIGVWTTHLKRSVSINMTWKVYMFFSYWIDLKTSF